jgi:hypothetical protein
MSNPVMLRLIDPHNYQQNRRVEFRLPPDSLYMSSIKVLNLGFSSSATTNGFSYQNGAIGCVKQISLLDGSKLLDSINDFNLYHGFKSFNKNNKTACDIDRATMKTRMGMLCVSEEIQKNSLSLTQEEWELAVQEAQPTNNQGTTPTAYLSLADYFPMLRNLGKIHTGLLKNFRVVIEFQQDASIYQPDTPAGDFLTTTPLLAVQQINDEAEANEYLREFKGVQWYSLENDRVLVSAIDGVTATNQNVQTNNFRLNGFNGKTVNRFLMSKTSLQNFAAIGSGATTPTSSNYGKGGSEAQHNERLQVRINGANLLPGNGISSPSEALARLNDAYGVCVTPVACNIPNFVDSVNHTSDDEDLGRLNYFGMNVANKRVNDLQVTYERKAVHMPSDADQKLSRFNQALNFNVMGEVLKSLVPNSNGGYSIVYN